MEGVTLDLLEAMNKPGPRYTSYPTAPNFTTEFGPERFARALGSIGSGPLSIYVHLPFCAKLCLYCGCNTVITTKPGVATRYLDALEAEVATVARWFGERPRVTQLHLGGGTPTYLTVPELERLHAILARSFSIERSEEKAVELDPRVTSVEQLQALARLGFNRASFGVQDFAPEVQRAVNRVQPVAQTRALHDAARALGYRGINVDLIYGLPRQRVSSFRVTVSEVLAMRPDRIALYSYAHVPWLKPGQRGFDSHAVPMPSPEEKLAIFQMAIDRFLEAGYRHIGMDHFALPGDELARALDEGHLHRNFQGYTVRQAKDLLGLGQSSISDLAGVYAQNEKENAAYEAVAKKGSLATIRGCELTREDERRRRAILAIMCEGRLEGEDAVGFEREIESLAPLEDRGLVVLSPSGVSVTPLGRLFLRNVAMAFDGYLGATADRARFSKTI